MIANRFRPLFRLSIPVCLLTGLLLATPGVSVRSAPAATPYVVSTTVDEFGTGSNCSLREAIQSVNTNTNFGGCTGNGDVITLPAGTYTLTGAAHENGNATGDLDVKSNLTIYGAGSKTTIIQAGTDATNGVDRVLHIFYGYTLEIDDVTIRYGKAPDGVMAAEDSSCDGSDGGGIYGGEDTALILNDCVVIYNRAGDGGAGCPSSYGTGGHGGGIYAYQALELNDTTVRQNESGAGGSGALGNPAHNGGDGGGIYLHTGEATLTDSIISQNTTGAGGEGDDVVSGTAGDGALGGDGGGICNQGVLTLTNTTVTGNRTGVGGDGGASAGGDGGDGGDSGYGAGIVNSGSTLVAVQSAVYDNATGAGGRGGAGTGYQGSDGHRGDGGGLYSIDESEVTLRGCTIRDNDANYGSGLYAHGGTTMLDDCTISGNTASGYGGGVYNWDGNATLDGCTINDNTTLGNGGGVYNTGSQGTLVLTNSTLSGNGAYSSGGGIRNNATATLTFVTVAYNTADVDNDGNGDSGGISSPNTLTMTNTIVAENEDKGGEDPDCSGSIASGDYNLLGVGDSAGCAFTSQPHDQVGTTASPIDPLLGVLGDNGGPAWTHRLGDTSPAVDQIPVGVNGCVVGIRDQRGVLRLPPCDIGAYEIDPESVYFPLVVKD